MSPTILPMQSKLARLIKQTCQAPLFPLSLAVLCTPVVAQASEQAQVPDETIVVTASALKVATPMAESPTSVSVVNRDDLDIHQVQKLDEAFRYNAGVLSAPYGADNDTDWLKVRGFDAATYLDGSRLFKDGYYGWMIEPYGLDRVELLKGPASILYGEAPPGGVINAVTKKPTYEPRGEINVQAGNKDHKQVGIDVSDSVNGRDDMRFRIVGIFKDGDGELNGTENTRYYFAPSLAIDLSADTTLTLLASVLYDDGVPTNGFFPAYGTLIDTPFGKIDPSTNLGEPDYDRYRRTQVSLGYQLDHQINDTWEFAQNAKYGYNKLLLRSTYAFPSDSSTTLQRGLVFRDGDTESFTVDNKAVGRWYSDYTEQTLLLGLDLQSHRNSGKELDSYSFGTIDAFDPQYGNFTPIDPNTAIDRRISKQQAGLYAQYQMRLYDQWVGIVGGRFDYVETQNKNGTADTREARYDSEFSPNAGLMYLAENGMSPYVSYSESFEVLTTIDTATNELYKPLKGKQTEVGVKYTPDAFDGYINLAWFNLEEENALVTNPNTWVKTQTGEVKSKGVELEGVGYITDDLKLTASYTYTDARTDETYGKGKQRAGMIPRHMASAWFDYDFTSAGLEGFRLGSGIRYVGTTVDNPASSHRQVAAYTLWDAVAQYDINRAWQAQLNINNITDKEYVSSCDYYCYYGESRRVVASLNYRW